MVKRLQNKIAGSRFALPVTAVYSIMIWLAGGLIANQLYLHFLLFGLSAYLMVELNNSNSLIRIYSRMVSCSFMALTLMSAFLFDSTDVWVVQFCVVATYLILFKCYQNKRSQGLVFYAFSSSALPASFHSDIILRTIPMDNDACQPHVVQHAFAPGVTHRHNSAILVSVGVFHLQRHGRPPARPHRVDSSVCIAIPV